MERRLLANLIVFEIRKTTEMAQNGLATIAGNNSKKAAPRRISSLCLIVGSFLAGTIFGGSVVKMHLDTLKVGFDTFENGPPSTMLNPSLNEHHRRVADRQPDSNNGGSVPSSLAQLDISALCGTAKPGTLPKISLLSNITSAIQQKAKAELLAQFQAEHQTPPVTHPTFCPNALCINTDLCKPCQRRFIIIVTTPRSASTTLTWMFDYLPGVRMAGENNNTLGFLKRATDNIVKNQNFRFQTNTRTSWGHRFMPNQTLACTNQKFIESISPPALKKGGRFLLRKNEAGEIVGFKTIRFFKDKETEEEMVDMVQYLKQNFPCSKVVININSNIESQAKSLDKNFLINRTANETLLYIKRENEKLEWLNTVLGPQKSFLLDKSIWTRNISVLNEAVSWLGFSKACHYTELLEFNVKDGYGVGRTKIKPKRGCFRI